jgi:tRNA 2-thiouridine synthesizing protein A
MDENTDKTRVPQIDADGDAFSRSLGEIERVSPDHEWDAGDMGCGELVFHLSLRLKPMRPGQLLKLTARDLGVPEDLPAWCRLTGHHLTYANHPIYLLRRRED